MNPTCDGQADYANLYRYSQVCIDTVKWIMQPDFGCNRRVTGASIATGTVEGVEFPPFSPALNAKSQKAASPIVRCQNALQM